MSGPACWERLRGARNARVTESPHRGRLPLGLIRRDSSPARHATDVIHGNRVAYCREMRPQLGDVQGLWDSDRLVGRLCVLCITASEMSAADPSLIRLVGRLDGRVKREEPGGQALVNRSARSSAAGEEAGRRGPTVSGTSPQGAVEIFSRRGYRGTSMLDIAKRSGWASQRSITTFTAKRRSSFGSTRMFSTKASCGPDDRR